MQRKSCTLLSLLVLFSLLAPAGGLAAIPARLSRVGAVSTTDALNVELLGQVGGAARASATQGNYSYLGVGPRLVILDISNPASPVFVGQTVPMPQPIQDVVIAGAYAYIADGEAGLRVVNLAVPAEPVEVGFADTPGDARGVVVAGSYAYMADYTGGLRVISIADPTHPIEVGAFDFLEASLDVAITGSYVFLVDADMHLLVLDVSDPTNPVHAGYCDTPGETLGVFISGSYAYVADDTNGLRVINITNPTDPVEVRISTIPQAGHKA